jgi:hypothetical protein
VEKQPKAAGACVDCSRPSSAEEKSELSYTSISLLHLHGGHKDNLALPLQSSVYFVWNVGGMLIDLSIGNTKRMIHVSSHDTNYETE